MKKLIMFIAFFGLVLGVNAYARMDDTDPVAWDNIPPVIFINDYETNPTNQDIIVTATTNEGTLNENSHTFTQNDSFTFTATDAAGNVTNETITITNIDKVAPTATVSYSTTDDTTGSVVATITPSEEVVGDLSHTFNENGSYTFNFTDLAGNTGSVTATVNNIRAVSGSSGGGSSYVRPITPNTTPVVNNVISEGKVLGENVFKFTKHLKLGSKGTEVLELQKRLASEGLYAGLIDGIFGKITKKAVIDFQVKNNIKSVGEVGPLTRAALNK